jgi:hypothetical protein
MRFRSSFLPILPNFWSIWHLYKNEFPTHQERAAWILAQVVLPVIGGVGYILFGRKRALKNPNPPDFVPARGKIQG